ncbi:MAG: tetratricopeptide repeat protein [bacterium]
MNKHKTAFLLNEMDGYHLLEMYDRVIDRADSLLKLNKFVKEALSYKADSLKSKNDFNNAIITYNELLALDKSPDIEQTALLGLGWCFKRTQRLDKAILCLEQLADHQPDQAIALFNLSCYYSLDCRREESLALLKKAVEKDGRYKDLARVEEDYNYIRNDPEFKKIIGDN